jgi:hypothetical protein
MPCATDHPLRIPSSTLAFARRAGPRGQNVSRYFGGDQMAHGPERTDLAASVSSRRIGDHNPEPTVPKTHDRRARRIRKPEERHGRPVCDPQALRKAIEARDGLYSLKAMVRVQRWQVMLGALQALAVLAGIFALVIGFH